MNVKKCRPPSLWLGSSLQKGIVKWRLYCGFAWPNPLMTSAEQMVLLQGPDMKKQFGYYTSWCPHKHIGLRISFCSQPGSRVFLIAIVRGSHRGQEVRVLCSALGGFIYKHGWIFVCSEAPHFSTKRVALLYIHAYCNCKMCISAITASVLFTVAVVSEYQW